jgi:probable O-glycosylation ligase (exosortase A-associated)
MDLRDIAVVSVAALGAAVALRRPWIGVLAWTWISLMNPHRLCWGFAVNFPLGMMTAVATLVGFLVSSDRKDMPFKGAPVVLLAIYMVWMTLSWRLGRDPEGDFEQWDKVMKIDFMILVALALLRTKLHIITLAWVVTLSMALLGAKGGWFTIVTGGAHKVFGPPGSFIGDNNHMALAMVMTVPLLRFLQLQLPPGWQRHAMTVTMVLVAASALGSHSRGALLAIAAMSIFLWWRGGRHLGFGLMIVLAGAALVAFMPDEWAARMATIDNPTEDKSAMGRIAAWWVAWGVAKHEVFGVGFLAARPELFVAYSPYGLTYGTPAAHSIYFQVMGHHGFIGLALFLGIYIATWHSCWRLRKESRGIPQARWCADLANMAQVSLLGYAAGGAFLSMAYFDLPLNVMVLVVLTRVWLRKRMWETEPAPERGWRNVPGLVQPEDLAGRPRAGAAGQPAMPTP